jgi:ABC-type antimicrobial peptide transport system permease subunit
MTSLDGVTERTLHIRTAGEPRLLIDVLRARLREIDPNIPLFNVKTLQAGIDESLTQDRLVTWLSTALGLLATLLATIGLYGVIAFTVAQRTREVGIRMALGAQRLDIFGLIMKRVSLFVAGGLIAGLFLALAGSRLLEGILFGVGAGDPLTFALATIVLLLAAAFAAYLPARRALRVNPSVALRCE